jgi:polyhydroxybutyrate depolymerase
VIATLLPLAALLFVPRAGRAQELAPGDHAFSLQLGGLTREYDVHVPASYDGTTPVPLVLDFHGFTSNRAQQAFISGFRAKSDEVGFLVAFPQGWQNSWNAGDLCCGAAQSQSVDDVGFAKAIVSALSSVANIDPARVYATGLSNGGAMSHLLACEAADVFAATAPVAFPLGLDPLSKCQPARPIPVLHFHGFNDATVPYAGGSIGLGLVVVSAQESFGYWGQVNGCNVSSTEVTFQQGGSSCEKFADCAPGGAASLCSIVGPHVLYANSDNVNIAELAWSFFEGARLPIGAVTGKKLVVRDRTDDPTKRRLAVVSKDPEIRAPDTDPTVRGGRLDLFNPYTGAVDRLPLPASNWEGLGNPPGSRGFRYRDANVANPALRKGPCRVVILKPGKRLRAACVGDAIGYELNGLQGGLGVTLSIDDRPLACLLFGEGATILKDVSAQAQKFGLFKAKDSPAPSFCQVP